MEIPRSGGMSLVWDCRGLAPSSSERGGGCGPHAVRRNGAFSREVIESPIPSSLYFPSLDTRRFFVPSRRGWAYRSEIAQNLFLVCTARVLFQRPSCRKGSDKIQCDSRTPRSRPTLCRSV